MRLFKKVAFARQMVAFAPELKNRGVKEPKNITPKGAPRFLTRGINKVLKLKKKQSVNNALVFPSIAFIFYQNESKNRGKKKIRKEVGGNVVFSPLKKKKKTSGRSTFASPKVDLWFGDRYNKNINTLKKHKPMITIRVKVLQKKTKLIGVFDTLKIKPLFNVLQKFTDLLLKKNIYLIRETYPFICAGLKGTSTIGGFKKVLYNKILVQDRRLKPTYNRRKHNITHYMVVQNQFAKLDKTFVYLGKNILDNIMGVVLKTAYSTVPLKVRIKTKKHSYFNNKLSIRAKAIPNLVSIIEGQIYLLLWRNQFNGSLTKSRQDRRQGASQNLNIVCKNNTAILLKE
jgi:hypothetical protein